MLHVILFSKIQYCGSSVDTFYQHQDNEATATMTTDLVPLPPAYMNNIWSDEISLDDLVEWLYKVRQVRELNVRQIIRQARRIRAGGLTCRWWDEGVVFCPDTSVRFSDDFDKILQDYKDFEAIHGRDRSHGWRFKHPWKYLSHYKNDIYPIVLRERTKTFLAFLSTQEYPTSPTSIFAKMESRGIMERIYSFAISGKDVDALAPSAKASILP